MDNIKNIVILSCKKVTELMEKKLHVKLSTIEKAQLSIHTKVCSACKEYDKQSSFLNNALAADSKQNKQADIKNIDELKAQIISKLNSKK